MSEAEQPNMDRQRLIAEIDGLKAEMAQLQQAWPPGHFYSPIPSIEEVKRSEEEIFKIVPNEIPGISLNPQRQLNLLHTLKEFYIEQPYAVNKKKHLRYFFNNPNYTYGEAIVLFCMIRYLKPKKIIEIGSGYSSCVILDTNDLFFENNISCTFIDPYPNLLYSLIKNCDIGRIEIIEERIQDVNLDIFSKLTAQDIILVDSSHVSKVGSDINHILFKILPDIESGIYIHFHDIGYPFEYPKEWIYQGRAWNETYLLRAFLMYNEAFRIEFFNSFLAFFFREVFRREMPMCMKNPGTSIWIQKT